MVVMHGDQLEAKQLNIVQHFMQWEAVGDKMAIQEGKSQNLDSVSRWVVGFKLTRCLKQTSGGTKSILK